MGKILQMPKLGMTMESGKIVKWLVKVGDVLEKNDPFIEVETDKVNLEVESLYSGTILKIYYNEGDDVPVTKPIAYIGQVGEIAPEMIEEVTLQETAVSKEEAKGEEKIASREEQTCETKKVDRNNEQMSDTKKDTNTNTECDLVIIGGGPGGYVAAIRAAQLGASVTVVEKDKLGGTCLNRGCIPTKALVKNAAVWRSIKESDSMGITVSSAQFDWSKILSRKNKVVNQLVSGVEGLFKKNKVKYIKGEAKILDSSTVIVTLPDNSSSQIKAKHIIIATGTLPAKVNIDVDPKAQILSTDDVLEFTSLPKSMAIIGGGYIGCEIASIYSTFGVEISIIELMPSILSMVDEDIIEVVQGEFVKRGIKIYTSSSISKITKNAGMNQIILSDGKVIEAEKILMAVGRAPSISVFESLGLKVNQRGYIQVNSKMETSIPNILAIGDITGNIQLAHVASAEGLVAVENLFGEKGEMSYDVVPSCIFTYPEIASVGMTQKQVEEKKIPYKTSKFPFYASGKALAIGETKGFVKIISDSRWDEILGVHIVGPDAADLIMEAVVAMKLEGTAQELAHTIHPHPTLSETIMEAAEGLVGRAIHI